MLKIETESFFNKKYDHFIPIIKIL